MVILIRNSAQNKKKARKKPPDRFTGKWDAGRKKSETTE